MHKRLPNKDELTDLVWVQTSYPGDIVLTTAAIDLARQAIPGVHQHLITTAAGAAALADWPPLTSRHILKKEGHGQLNAFRKVRAALAANLTDPRRTVTLQPHRSARSSLLTAFLGFPTVTYAETTFAWLATRTVARVAVLHETERIALLLTPLGISRASIVGVKPTLTPLPLREEDIWAHQLAGGNKIAVGIAPGSVWATKRWLPERYAELAQELLTDERLILAFIGSASEADLIDVITSKIAGDHTRIINLAGRTTLADLRRILPLLKLVIAGDSSPIHYAAAFQVPTVAIFGPTVSAMGFRPLANRAIVIESEVECRPCSDHGPAVCPLRHFDCMRKNAVGVVFNACRQLLRD